MNKNVLCSLAATDIPRFHTPKSTYVDTLTLTFERRHWKNKLLGALSLAVIACTKPKSNPFIACLNRYRTHTINRGNSGRWVAVGGCYGHVIIISPNASNTTDLVQVWNMNYYPVGQCSRTWSSSMSVRCRMRYNWIAIMYSCLPKKWCNYIFISNIKYITQMRINYVIYTIYFPSRIRHGAQCGSQLT